MDKGFFPKLDTVLGIDIGGTRTKIARISQDGKVQRLVTVPTLTHGDPAPYLERMKQEVELLLEEEPVRGIGLSLNGFLSEDMRSSRYSNNSPALEGIDFAAWLEKFGIPYRIEQDLNTPAVAEYYFGTYRQEPRLMTVSIGTGLGAGMLVNGQVVRLAGGTLGDAGHIILEPGGPVCTSGCRGCAEALVSVPGIERLAEQRGKPRKAHEIIALAREGEPGSTAVIETIGSWLGQWLASLAPIFLPNIILISGGVAEAGEILLRTADERLHALSGPEYSRCRVDMSHFGGLAGVIGAAAPLFFE